MWRLLCVLENIYLKVEDEGHRSPCSCPSQLAKNIYFECRYLISMQKYLPCSRTSRSNCCESAAVCCCAHMRGNWVTVSRLHNTICCPLGISTVHLGVEAKDYVSPSLPILCKHHNRVTTELTLTPESLALLSLSLISLLTACKCIVKLRQGSGKDRQGMARDGP